MVLRRAVAIGVLVAAVALSIILHMPTQVQRVVFGGEYFQPLYYDALPALHYSAFNPSLCGRQDDVWLNQVVKQEALCEGRGVYAVPLVDYRIFEPPLTVLLHMLLSRVSLAVAGSYTTDAYVATLYILQSITQVVLLIPVIYYLSEVAVEKKIFPVLVLTIVAYGVYRGDALTALLILLGYRYLARGDGLLALGFFTLAAQADFFWIFLPLLMLLDTRVEGAGFGRAGFLLASLSPIVVLTVLNPAYPSWLVESALRAGLNNSLYVVGEFLATRDVLSRLAGGIWIVALVLLVAFRPKNSAPGERVRYFPTAALALYLSSKQTLPQTMLPLLALFIVGNPGAVEKSKWAITLAEIANAAFLPLFPLSPTLAAKAKLLKIPASPEWYSIYNPTQWVIQLRNLLLLLVLVESIRSKIRQRPASSN